MARDWYDAAFDALGRVLHHPRERQAAVVVKEAAKDARADSFAAVARLGRYS